VQRLTITLGVGNSRSSPSPESLGNSRVKTGPEGCCVPPFLVGAPPPKISSSSFALEEKRGLSTRFTFGLNGTRNFVPESHF
jgi:hypothetical protein